MVARDVVKLDTSAAAFHTLAVAADKKTRGGNKWVKVSKAQLGTLLRDHGRVIAALKAVGVNTEDAPDAVGDDAEADNGDE